MKPPRTFFIGDNHFFHSRIIEYCNRPFAGVHEMNEALIKNHNKVVRGDDIVYFVGDFALCGKDNIIEIAKRLNGRKRLVLGNHDHGSLQTYRDAGFEYIYNHPIIVDNFFIVSHKPLECLPRNSVFASIYAHVHDDPSYKNVSEQSFCVSAERINYTPIDLEEIKRQIKEVRDNGEADYGRYSEDK